MKTITLLVFIAIIAGSTTFATVGSTIVTYTVAQSDNATMVGNMTGGNMTAGGGNSTDAAGQISGRSR